MLDWLRRFIHRKKARAVISIGLDEEEEGLDLTIEGDIEEALLAEALRLDKERLKRLKKGGYIV